MVTPRGNKKKSRSSKGQGTNHLVMGILGGGGAAVIVGLVVFMMMGRGDTSSSAPLAQAVAIPLTATPAVSPPATVAAVPVVNSQPQAVTAARLPSPANSESPPATVTSTPAPVATVITRGSRPRKNRGDDDAPASRTPREEMSYPDLVEQTDRSIVRINVESARGQSLGSGFVVSDTGIVVTNYHVIEGGQTIKAQFEDNRECDVTGFLLFDDERDIAIIQLDPSGAPFVPITLADELPRKGEEVAAFGAPLGLSFTASKGTVSNVRDGRELQMKGMYLQTDTPISPGNSGGPLVSMMGEVVGMNSFQMAIGQNLNFAVSVNDIREVLGESEGKSPRRITPTSVPPKARGLSGGAGGSGDPEKDLVDLTGTERADKLLAQMTESFLLIKPFEIDPSGRINDYMFDKLKKTVKNRLKLELNRVGQLPVGQPVIVMGVMADNPEDEKIQGKAIELSLEVYVILLDIDKNGNHIPSIVWREKSKLANLSVKAMALGTLPRSVTDGSQKFFDKFVASVLKARKAHGGNN